MRFRLSSSFALIAVGSLLYSVYVIAGSTPTATSSSPCLTPSFAVDLYLQSLAVGLFEDVGVNDTGIFKEEACEETCKKMRGTCRGITKTSKSCVNSSSSKAIGVQEESCSQLIDPADRTSCRDDVRALLDDIKNFTKFDAKAAKQCCEDSFEPCILACLAGNASLIPLCDPQSEVIVGCI